MANGITEWIMAGGVVVISGFSIATYAYVNKVKDNNEKKIGRNYERLDEVKADADNNYTRKDVCKILHQQISSDLTEIKTDIKLLLRKNGIDKK